MFIVIEDFVDLQDFMETKSGKIYHKYRTGDIYPRKDAPVAAKAAGRINALSTDENARRIPLIKAFGMPEEETAAAPADEGTADEGTAGEKQPEEGPKKEKTKRTKE